MSNVIDDYEFGDELPPQESPKPIKGKIKKNIQRWVFISILLIATPIAIWQGLREEKTGIEDWKVKELERTAAQARGGQASGDSVKQITILATEQKHQADIAASAQPASSVVATVAGGPLPHPPSTAPEDMPIAPLIANKQKPVGGDGKRGSHEEFNAQVTASSIILLSGGGKKNDAQNQLSSLLPPSETLTPKDQTPALPSSLDMINALKPQAPSSRAEAAQQWMKGQQQPEAADGAGIYARPAHKDTVIMEGTMLNAAFLTAINTDLPGDVTAIVTRDVYDSMNPEKYLLIPKGSKLIGSYNSEVNIGQERIMMAFKRLIFPDGSSVDLLGMAGTDAMGRAGLEGDVNNHFIKMFGASFMIAGVSKLLTPKQPANVNVYGAGGGQLTTETGAILTDISGRILRRNENLPPTITIQAGERFNVRVNKDMHLPPYRVH